MAIHRWSRAVKITAVATDSYACEWPDAHLGAAFRWIARHKDSVVALIAGYETTTRLIGNAIFCFTQRVSSAGSGSSRRADSPRGAWCAGYGLGLRKMLTPLAQ